MAKKDKTPTERIAVRATGRGFYNGSRIRVGEIFLVSRAVFEAQAKKGEKGFKWFEPVEPTAAEEALAIARDAAVDAKKAKDEAVQAKLQAAQDEETKRVRSAQNKARVPVKTEKPEDIA